MRSALATLDPATLAALYMLGAVLLAALAWALRHFTEASHFFHTPGGARAITAGIALFTALGQAVSTHQVTAATAITLFAAAIASALGLSNPSIKRDAMTIAAALLLPMVLLSACATLCPEGQRFVTIPPPPTAYPSCAAAAVIDGIAAAAACKAPSGGKVDVLVCAAAVAKGLQDQTPCAPTFTCMAPASPAAVQAAAAMESAPPAPAPISTGGAPLGPGDVPHRNH